MNKKQNYKACIVLVALVSFFSFGRVFSNNLVKKNDFRENLLNLSDLVSLDLEKNQHDLDSLLFYIVDFLSEFDTFKNNLDSYELGELNEKIIFLKDTLKKINSLDLTTGDRQLLNDFSDNITRLDLLDLNVNLDEQVANVNPDELVANNLDVNVSFLNKLRNIFCTKPVEFFKNHKKVTSLILASGILSFYFLQNPEKAKKIMADFFKKQNDAVDGTGEDNLDSQESDLNFEPEVFEELPLDAPLDTDELVAMQLDLEDGLGFVTMQPDDIRPGLLVPGGSVVVVDGPVFSDDGNFEASVDDQVGTEFFSSDGERSDIDLADPEDLGLDQVGGFISSRGRQVSPSPLARDIRLGKVRSDPPTKNMVDGIFYKKEQ